MIDKRKITVNVQLLLDKWLDETGAESRLNVDELEHLAALIERAIESAFRQGYAQGINPPRLIRLKTKVRRKK